MKLKKKYVKLFEKEKKLWRMYHVEKFPREAGIPCTEL